MNIFASLILRNLKLQTIKYSKAIIPSVLSKSLCSDYQFLLNFIPHTAPFLNSCFHSSHPYPSKLDPSLATPTIFAVSSGLGRAGVCVIRVSGPASGHALASLMAGQTLNNDQKPPTPRKMAFRRIYDPQTGRHLDTCLVVFFRGPKSFTGEDSFELHLHGGPAVVSSVLDCLSQIPSLEHAQPGQFTRRAVMNGKLDLAEAEGIVDLINAETDVQQTLALSHVEGSLSCLYNLWMDQLKRHSALIEAAIDFSEDNQLDLGEKEMIEQLHEEIQLLRQEMRAVLETSKRGERIKDGVKVVIAGKPNAGKSSLTNLLLGREASIVTPIAGTTRDVLTSYLNLDGYPVVISDTAGLRAEELVDVVEREGIKRAKNQVSSCDVLIILVDATEITDLNTKNNFKWNLKTYMEELGIKEIVNQPLPEVMVVINKVDLIKEAELIKLQQFLKREMTITSFDFIPELSLLSCVPSGGWHISISRHDKAHTNADPSCLGEITNLQKEYFGFNHFSDSLTRLVANLCSGNSSHQSSKSNCRDISNCHATSEMPLKKNLMNSSVVTRARHKEHIIHCERILKDCALKTDPTKNYFDLVLIADDLNRSRTQLGKITGLVTNEDILDMIFREFCVGK